MEHTAVNNDVNTEHVDSCTTQSTGVLVHELPFTISDFEVQRQIAKLASELHKIRARRDRMKREIATRVHALPEKEGMEKTPNKRRKE